MSKRRETPPHITYITDESGADTKQVAAYIHKASHAAIKTVLSAPEGNNDGRSEYCWLRLQNGDLMLGVFPRGDIYLTVEDDAVFPAEST